MISENFNGVVTDLMQQSAPMKRDQSSNSVHNVGEVLTKLADISDEINHDKSGVGESYKLLPRYGVQDDETVFIYEDRSRVVIKASGALTSALTNQSVDGVKHVDNVVAVYGGDTVTSIGVEAFKECKKLKIVSFKNVTTIGSYAFFSCNNLEQVDMPKVTSIAECAFYGCSSLKKIELPNLATVSGSSTFGSTGCEEIDLPALTSVVTSMFNGCSNLKRVYIPKAKSIGADSFKGCSSLVEIHFGNSLTSVATLSSTTSLPDSEQLNVVVPNDLVDNWSSASVWKDLKCNIVSTDSYKLLRISDIAAKLSAVRDLTTNDDDFNLESINAKVDTIIDALKSIR